MGLSLLIVVLHYRGLDDTLECIASLGRQSYRNQPDTNQSTDDIHTVVVDNASADGLRDRLAAEYPWVEVLELAENRGWSGGNNAGIRIALARRMDVVCLLNNDTVLPADAVEKLLATAAFLGPCILHPAINSYDEGDGVQLDPAIPQPPELRATPIVGRPGVFEISSINGACLMAHLSVFLRIGLIDERFFLLCDDADLGARAVAAGYRMFCDASVRIQHKESRSFGGRRKPIKTYYGVRNILLFCEKHDGVWRNLLRAARTVVWTAWGAAEVGGADPRTLWGLLRWSLSSDLFARAVRMGVRDYLLRRFGRINKGHEDILTAGYDQHAVPQWSQRCDL